MSALAADGSPGIAPIVVVGSVNVDTVLRVEHLPNPGETIIASSAVERHGGKGANQAVFAAALLAGVALVGCVGDDDRGARALAALQHANVDHSRVRANRGETGIAIVVVDTVGENSIVLSQGANALVRAEDVEAAVRTLAGPESIVLVGLEIPDDAIAAAAITAREVGARLVINPAPGRIVSTEVLGMADVVVPNAVEVSQVTRAGTPEAILDTGARALVVTRGSLGAEIYLPDRPSLMVAPPNVRVVDTTGAGDAFVAALTVGLHDGLELEAAARMAVIAGSIAVTGLGPRGALSTRARIAELAAP